MRIRRSATASAPNGRRLEMSHSSSSSRRTAMRQSSSSIGALATALAKAQTELVNPEKSMIATIRSDDNTGGDQIFRYAPLSSGLEILRKTLGQYEIAVLQATAIDQAAGVVKPTTALCHSSGEWVGSTWPVCSLEDMASPKRMGAALTYARRYALFALVAIAGEDDLDAPDLFGAVPLTEKLNVESKSSGNGGQKAGSNRRAGCARPNKFGSGSANSELSVTLSASLKAELLSEVECLAAADDAALWAQRRLTAKNQLSATDAQQLEEAFAAKLAVIQAQSAKSDDALSEQTLAEQTSAAAQINKSVLVFPEPRRVRDRDHIRHVIKQPCLVCGRRPSDPHHLRFAQSRALGRKVSDEFTVPLCRGHHRELHRHGDETGWWQKLGLDPTSAARALWLTTHPQSQPVI